MMRICRIAIPLLFGVILISFANSQQGKKFSIKTNAGAAPPKELAEPIQKLLGDSSVTLMDGSGKPICDVWFRKELPSDATGEQLKTGVTFREVKQSEILGAIHFHVNWTDYRKQRIKAGVYTLRLAYQPKDGKHTADISDFQEFALVIHAKHDQRPGLMEEKKLADQSGESLDLAHPGVFMLWPVTKLAAEPSLDARPKDHWVVNSSCNLIIGGKATANKIGIGLTLVGHSPAE